MRLCWDEIKRRAKAFSTVHANAHYEKGETQTFYNVFFDIFGFSRRSVAVYEKRVKSLDQTCAARMPRSIARSTNSTAPRPSPATATGWSICSGGMRRW